MNLPDKRYLPRWQVENHISYQSKDSDHKHFCRSKDLSSVGICLKTREKIPLNEKVKLTVHLSENVRFPAEGHVLWSRPVADGHLVGVHFDHIEPHDQELILQFAFELKRDDIVKHWFSGWSG